MSLGAVSHKRQSINAVEGVPFRGALLQRCGALKNISVVMRECGA